MEVWLLHIGEDLPCDPGGRSYRYGRLAAALAACGCHVTRWAPTVRHATKTQRATADTLQEVADGVDLQLVRTRTYRRNIGLGRWLSYNDLVRGFERLAPTKPRPDLIVSAIPMPAWSASAVRFGRRCGAPVVVDIRDLWPDVYLTAIPKSLRGVGRLALTPAIRKAARVCREADALWGVSEAYLNWALDLAGRSRSACDRVVPICHEAAELTDSQQRAEERALAASGVDLDAKLVVYAGLMEHSYDLDTVVAAAERLRDAGRSDVQFVLCGDGARLESLRQRAAKLCNVVFPGWVSGQTLTALVRRADIGLAAYAADALQSLPNKPFEYMEGGLAVLSTLRGELAELLDTHQCGLSYQPGDAVGLAEQIDRLTNDTGQLAGMKRRSRELYETRFDSQKVYAAAAEQLLAIAASKAPVQRAA